MPLRSIGVKRALDNRTKDGDRFQAKFVRDLSAEVSKELHLGAVDMWLDGYVLRAIVPEKAGELGQEALRQAVQDKVRRKG